MQESTGLEQMSQSKYDIVSNSDSPGPLGKSESGQTLTKHLFLDSIMILFIFSREFPTGVFSNKLLTRRYEDK